jgi:hypothetical protein
MSSLTV